MKRILSRKWAAGLIVGLAACVAIPLSVGAATPTLQFNGSTTVAPIIQQTEPGFETLYSGGVDVLVAATGSGTGLNTILQGRGTPWVPNPLCDIAMASRPVKASDDAGTGTSGQSDPWSKLGWKGNVSQDNGWKIARDGVCMVVYDNPSTSDALDGITCIKTSQIKAIYEAQAGICSLTWQSLDATWPNANVIPHMRITTSGTRETLYEKCPFDAAKEVTTFSSLQNCDGDPDVDYPRHDGNPEMAAAINSGANQGAMGYVGIGFLGDPAYPNIRALQVQDDTHTPPANGGVCTTPTKQSCLNGTYALARDLFLYTTQLGYYNPNNTYIPRFLRYIYSDAGQDAVEAKGFVRIDEGRWNVDAKGITNVTDVAQLALHWGENTKTTYPLDSGNLPAPAAGVPGWARYDCNADGQVNVSDVAQIALHWGQP